MPADRWDRVDLLTPPGPLWLMVDHPLRWRSGDSSRPCPVGWPPADDCEGRLVHLISDYAGGEIRGYVLVGGELYHRYAAEGPWPEVDVLVCRALGVPVPERMAGARALAAGSDVRLVPAERGLRIEVTPHRQERPQLGLFEVPRG